MVAGLAELADRLKGLALGVGAAEYVGDKSQVNESTYNTLDAALLSCV